MSQSVETMWSPGFLDGELKSHPDRLLRDHLEGTYRLMSSMAQVHGLEAVVPDFVMKIVGVTHDLGKAHLLFQDYLNGRGDGIDHALPSAWFTFNFAKDYINENNIPVVWLAEAVRRHHTHMVNGDEAITFWLQYNGQDFEKQKKEIKELIPSWNVFLSEDQWDDYTCNLMFKRKKIMNEESWLFYRLLYSLLVTADRMDAIGVRKIEARQLPSFRNPDFSRQESSPLDAWRQQTRESCTKSVDDIVRPGLYTLTLPTGAGKTITGLDIARKMAQKFGSKTIIYALPFISIVEQNSSVAKTIFGEEDVQEDHSLSSLKETDEKLQEPISRMKALFRYWEAPIILTTMVQLWESIYNPKANDTIDFHRLGNAIVIMDEPQTINPRYWRGFGETLKYLSGRLNTSFMLMTATQPHIIKGKELSPKGLTFPYNRHTYKILPCRYQLEELPDLLEEHIEHLYERSGLIVLNTRKSALKIYKLIKTRMDAPVYFLSTWMTPHHRRVVMRFLKYLERKKIKHYLVSTQVVEAGVDLDFDWVFRDMGPLDSVVQVAGRCNRHGKNETSGLVLVAELFNEQGKSFSDMIYDDILLDSSRSTLRVGDKINVFEESEAPVLVDNYYQDITERLQDSGIWRNICNGRWGLQDKPSLIEKRFDPFLSEVYVEQSHRVRPMLGTLANTKWTLENLSDKRRLNRKLLQYSIEVPQKELESWRKKLANVAFKDDLPPLDFNASFQCWFLTKEGSKYVYDRISGFNPAEDSDNEGETCFF
ncbi:CRISPR-associated helicase Cas3' [Acetomicrobium sp.]|jgi:CRISPR-associated endonuclease/helicase Cas3|uniref:CRISPR-associated helicase Cas3' n=1 Tax=Acetomicrobium sp. TaxID=1872099 RepID=UPI001698BF0D|nr:CRISPR-associated helicase Cas3' [Acetomicrobium sp.]MDR9768836.1 CRISPR-associated helicase Cas3' [Acetomicrobium sp.]NLI42119.1 CRISPR-associated helicase Cas3' [Synergistaceae bacterium]HUM42926.1 CRISPR-associated helicase Cas3' [Fervidobacterium sp.]